MAREKWATQTIINVDGPYGNALADCLEHDVLVLVAGGIGITPVHSILKYLYNMALVNSAKVVNSAKKEKVPAKVHLIWVVRETVMFKLFLDTLTKVQQFDYNGSFVLHLYTTNMKPQSQEISRKINDSPNDYEDKSTTLRYNSGRPNIEEVKFL